MKILHLPTSTAGFSSGLSEIEKKNKHDSKVLFIDKNKFGYKCDYLLYNNNLFVRFFLKLKFFFKNRNQFNIFHFNFGKSLFDPFYVGLPMFDMPFYNGKRIVTFNGSDIRGWTYKIYKDEISKILDKSYSKNYKVVIKRFFLKLKKNHIEKYADHIFAVNPDLLHFLPKRATFLPYAISEWDKIKKVESFTDGKIINIVHAPTNRKLKGSEYVIKALKRLKKKYSNINIIIVENMSYKEALNKYKKADLFIDQVLIGWYGGVSVELMKMGKAVAVYIRKEDLKFIPNEMSKDLLNSIININPFNIESELEKYILDLKKLKYKSELGYDYVNKWHNPEYIYKLISSTY